MVTLVGVSRFRVLRMGAYDAYDVDGQDSLQGSSIGGLEDSTVQGRFVELDLPDAMRIHKPRNAR